MKSVAQLKDNGFSVLKSARMIVPALFATVGSVVSSCGDKGEEPTPQPRTPKVVSVTVDLDQNSTMTFGRGAYDTPNGRVIGTIIDFEFKGARTGFRAKSTIQEGYEVFKFTPSVKDGMTGDQAYAAKPDGIFGKLTGDGDMGRTGDGDIIAEINLRAYDGIQTVSGRRISFQEAFADNASYLSGLSGYGSDPSRVKLEGTAALTGGTVISPK